MKKSHQTKKDTVKPKRRLIGVSQKELGYVLKPTTKLFCNWCGEETEKTIEGMCPTCHKKWGGRVKVAEKSEG